MAVGMHKAKAVKEALSYIAPGIEVDARVHRLAGQESSSVAAKVLKALASCHLIIDATADSDVFLRLAAVAQRHTISMCWGEVFAGGVGGLIARARPGTGPNPVAVRAGILNYLQGLPPAPFTRAERYDVDEQEPIVVDDADVSQIASAIARLALDTLVDREPTAFPHHAYLIGLRKDWIFSGAFDTQPIEIGGAGWENAAPRQEDLDAAIANLAAILKDTADDNAHPPTADPGQNSNSVA